MMYSYDLQTRIKLANLTFRGNGNFSTLAQASCSEIPSWGNLCSH